VREAEFQAFLMDYARRLGYMLHHDLPAQSSKGRWLTAGSGDAGFPDLVCLHPQAGTFFVAELKSDRGRLRTSQENWLAAFSLAGIPNYVWRPSDKLTAMRIIQEGSRRRWDYGSSYN